MHFGGLLAPLSDLSLIFVVHDFEMRQNHPPLLSHKGISRDLPKTFLPVPSLLNDFFSRHSVCTRTMSGDFLSGLTLEESSGI